MNQKNLTTRFSLIFLFVLLNAIFNVTLAENLAKEKSVQYAISPIFESVGNFHEGLAPVKINHKWGFIDKTGKVVVEPQFNFWQAQFNSSFSDGLVAVNFSSGKDENSNVDGNNVSKLLWGFADKKGNLVIPPIFMGDYYRPPYFSEGMASVMASSLFPNSQTLLSVSAKYGYIDKKGEFLIEPVFDQAYRFVGGLAIVEVDGKFGFINTKGSFVVPPIYELLEEFSCVFQNLLTIRSNPS